MPLMRTLLSLPAVSGAPGRRCCRDAIAVRDRQAFRFGGSSQFPWPLSQFFRPRVRAQLSAQVRKQSQGACPWPHTEWAAELGLELSSSASFYFSPEEWETAQEMPPASRQPESEGWQSEGFPAHVQILMLAGKLLIEGSLKLI